MYNSKGIVKTLRIIVKKTPKVAKSPSPPYLSTIIGVFAILGIAAKIITTHLKVGSIVKNPVTAATNNGPRINLTKEMSYLAVKN